MIGNVEMKSEIPSGKLLRPFDFRRLLWYLVLRVVNWEQTPFPCSGNWVGMMNASAPFSNPEPAGIFLKRIVIIEKEERIRLDSNIGLFPDGSKPNPSFAKS